MSFNLNLEPVLLALMNPAILFAVPVDDAA
jgi:hypothetical protein